MSTAVSSTLNLSDRTYQFIRQKLASGELGPEGRLREEALAKELGVSRTPVREALRRLQSEGLVQQSPNCGVSVKILSSDELRDIMELRELLEGYAVTWAAENLSEDDFGELEAYCDQIHEIVKVVHMGKLTRLDGELKARWIQADLGFHRKLIEATGNRVAIRILDDLQILSRFAEFCRDNFDGNGLLQDMARTWRDHRRVLRALRKGDSSSARHYMTVHLRTGLEQALEAGVGSVVKPRP